LPKLTALLGYTTLNSRVGLNCGITSGTIFAAVNAALAWARAFAFALAQVCLSSRVAAGMATAEAEARKVKSDKSCMVAVGSQQAGQDDIVLKRCRMQHVGLLATYTPKVPWIPP